MQEYLINGPFRPTRWDIVHFFHIDHRNDCYMTESFKDFHDPINAECATGRQNNMWWLKVVNYSNFDNLFTLCTLNNNTSHGCLMKTKENKLVNNWNGHQEEISPAEQFKLEYTY